LFCLHYFKPTFDRFFDVRDGFFSRLPLLQTTWQCWNLSGIVACLILFDHDVQLHTPVLLHFIRVVYVSSLS
jgi:hypothetical protein